MSGTVVIKFWQQSSEVRIAPLFADKELRCRGHVTFLKSHGRLERWDSNQSNVTLQPVLLIMVLFCILFYIVA